MQNKCYHIVVKTRIMPYKEIYMKRKIISLLLALSIVLSITACNGNAKEEITTTGTTAAQSESQTTDTSDKTTDSTTAPNTDESTTASGTDETTAKTETTTVPTDSTTQKPTDKTTTTEKTTAKTTVTTKKTTAEITTTEKKDEDKTYLKLSNPNATKTAQKVYEYLQSIEGNHILSGQQESTWMSSPDYEMKYIQDATGKLPAIRGLDYINNDFLSATTRAINWWNDGGIPSICWHWGAPPDGVGYESSKGQIDMTEALTEGTDLYNAMIASMDTAATQLKRLQDNGVVVLWRPFHEFDGGWFWWGKGTAEQFKQLWQLMYDRYTNYWKLNNLIWVLGFADNVTSGWYPGDKYVDVVGSDTYKTRNDTVNNNAWVLFKRNYPNITLPKAFHENGKLPEVSELIDYDVEWVWFMTWHTNFVTETNTKEKFNEVYNSDYVITLDELPDFT